MANAYQIAWGICDRCGQRYYHRTLKKEWTNLLVCEECFEEKHPQLTLPRIDFGDPYPIDNPRPEPPVEPSDNDPYYDTYPDTAGGGPEG